MKKKPEILTPARKNKIRQEAIEKTMLLAALTLVDYFQFTDEDIRNFWNKSAHYADIVHTPEAGIKMEYVCELLEKNGTPVHWRW